jgi:hypothetical protein
MPSGMLRRGFSSSSASGHVYSIPTKAKMASPRSPAMPSSPLQLRPPMSGSALPIGSLLPIPMSPISPISPTESATNAVSPTSTAPYWRTPAMLRSATAPTKMITQRSTGKKSQPTTSWRMNEGTNASAVVGKSMIAT